MNKLINELDYECKNAPRLFQGFSRAVSKLFSGCFQAVFGLFPSGCFRVVSLLFPDCLRAISDRSLPFLAVPGISCMSCILRSPCSPCSSCSSCGSCNSFTSSSSLSSLFLILRDFNISMADDNMNNFSETYDLKNLINKPTFYKNASNPSSIDAILMNRPRSFLIFMAIETGPSDHRKMFLTVLKSYCKNIKHIITTCGD